jgi:OOP family OmpA-OmpF porin
MRRLEAVALGLTVTMLVAGCAARDRKWGSCAVAGGIIGGAVGGITGGVVANNADDDPTDAKRGAAIGGGIGGGALIGALLGHAICDPMKEAPPPPPVAAPPPPPPPAKPMVTLKGPHFDFDKATLKPEGKRLVDQAVDTLKANPTMRVSVEGHTDAIGSEAYNLKLSERRADAVRDYMVSEGIDPSRISTEGFGKTRPVADNSTAEGRAENRRVEILQR